MLSRIVTLHGLLQDGRFCAPLADQHHVEYSKGDALSIHAEPVPERLHQNDSFAVRADACWCDRDPTSGGAFLAVGLSALVTRTAIAAGPICARMPAWSSVLT